MGTRIKPAYDAEGVEASCARACAGASRQMFRTRCVVAGGRARRLGASQVLPLHFRARTPFEVAVHASFSSDSSRPIAMISARTVARRSPSHAAMAWSVATSSASGPGRGRGARLADLLADMEAFRV